MKFSRDRIFWAYYCSLSKVKVLTAEEERELLQRYYAHGDIEARNCIINSCLRFVVKLASKFAKNVDELNQLISAGNEGLLVALEKFNPKREVRFLSYATYWALLYIRSERSNLYNVVSIPSWYNKLVQQINNYHMDMLSNKGRLASPEEICKKFGITKKQFAKLKHIHYQDIASNTVVEEASHAETIETKEIKQQIEWLLNQKNSETPLSVREIFILRAYFGFIDGTNWTLEQLANYLDLSTERVRQIKEQAIRTLKNAVSLKRIADQDGKLQADLSASHEAVPLPR